MSSFPFAISAEAAASIELRLESADGDPRFVGACPVLSMGLNYQMVVNGRLTEAYEGEFFSIGLDYPETVSGRQYTEFVIGTRKIWVSAIVLTELVGKRLVLEKVEVGVPRPADKTMQILRAVEL